MVESILLLLSVATLSIVSMDLALACIYRRRAVSHHTWTSFFIVFMATALGLVSVEILSSWSALMFSGTPRRVLFIIFDGLKKADGTFMMVFVPIFSAWVVGYPLSVKKQVFFFLSALSYLILGVLYILFPQMKIFDQIAYLMVILNLLFVNIVIAKNRRVVENRGIRLVTKSILLTATPLLTVSLVGIFVPFARELMIILCILAIGIVILIFLFIALSRKDQSSAMHLKKEPTLDDLKQYGITGREFDVILLIREGMTAKEIASRLTISVNTVNNHIANIFSKTGVRSRIDLLNLIQDIW
ncbi:MAG: helix-turn-helix transcriptional regulator [Spirochaetales bacterium]|nr:helix-turn-helix transcriptional regulator [Spirochaetales bacterium]